MPKRVNQLYTVSQKSTLVLTQPTDVHVVDHLLLKLSCDQDFPSDCLEFQGMWNIIGKGGDENKIINNVWFISVETNTNG